MLIFGIQMVHLRHPYSAGRTGCVASGVVVLLSGNSRWYSDSITGACAWYIRKSAGAGVSRQAVLQSDGNSFGEGVEVVSTRASVVVVRLGVVALWRRLGVVARLQVLSRVAASVSAIHSRTRSSIAAALLARLIVYDCGDI